MKFSNHDINKFILLLQKEYMDDWKSSVIQDYLEKRFSQSLNIKDITDSDDVHAKKLCKYFEISNLREYNDLYVQSDTLLLSDVFKLNKVGIFESSLC